MKPQAPSKSRGSNSSYCPTSIEKLLGQPCCVLQLLALARKAATANKRAIFLATCFMMAMFYDLNEIR